WPHAGHLRRPVCDVVDSNEPSVEMQHDGFAGPPVVHLREFLEADLLSIGYADPSPLAAHRGVHLAAGRARDVTVRQRVGQVSIPHQTPDRAEMLFALNLRVGEISSADETVRKRQMVVRCRWNALFLDQNCTRRYDTSVR